MDVSQPLASDDAEMKPTTGSVDVPVPTMLAFVSWPGGRSTLQLPVHVVRKTLNVGCGAGVLKLPPEYPVPAATVVLAFRSNVPWLSAVSPDEHVASPNVATPLAVLADNVELPLSFSPGVPVDDSVTAVAGNQLTTLPRLSSTAAVTGGHM